MRRIAIAGVLTSAALVASAGAVQRPADAPGASVADAVIVGSVLVERIEALAAQPDRIPDTVAGLLAPMRAALDALTGPARSAADAHAS